MSRRTMTWVKVPGLETLQVKRQSLVKKIVSYSDIYGR